MGIDISKFSQNTQNNNNVAEPTQNQQVVEVVQDNFDIVEYIKSSDIAEEYDNTREFAGTTVFWVVRKNN